MMVLLAVVVCLAMFAIGFVVGWVCNPSAWADLSEALFGRNDEEVAEL